MSQSKESLGVVAEESMGEMHRRECRGNKREEKDKKEEQQRGKGRKI